MKPHWYDLTEAEQNSFGNGCSFVPDFIYYKTCTRHDWFYSIGCGANRWYENIWKAPYHKIGEDIRFLKYTLRDAKASKHPVFYSAVAIVYFIGLTFLPFSWFVFTYGRWRTLDEVRQIDQEKKGY